MLALVFHYSASRRLVEIGLALGVIGGVLSALGRARRLPLLIGGLLLAVAFALVLVTVHWGTMPFRHVR